MRLLSCCRCSALPLRVVLVGGWLSLLPAGCASVAPPDVATPAPTIQPAERIALGFGWPAGFAARVSGAESSRVETDARVDESRSELSYRVSVEAETDGARIRYDDFAFRDPVTEVLVPLRMVPGLEALTGALRPSFVVSPDGRFGGTPGLDADVAAINRELDALHADPDGLPQGAPLLPTRFSGALFMQHAPVEWWPMVELWAGREIELGARYDVALVTRMPLLDGAPIRMNGELQVSGRVPCDEVDGERDEPALATPRCVELVLVTRPDPLALLPLLGEEGERRGPDGGAAPVTVTRLELDETVRIVTEPETLVPHRMATSKRARVRLRLSDGSMHTDALDQELELVFHPES